MQKLKVLTFLSIVLSAGALSTNHGRRNFVKNAIVGSVGASSLIPSIANADIEGVATPSFADSKPALQKAEGGKILYKTRSGLQYIILNEGIPDSPSPRYGQYVTIAYKSYIKLPDTPQAKSKLDEYDSDNQYLIKHGNGRIIPGLDEGLHSMKIGEKRRIIIPPKLGYVGPGVLGPIPDNPFGRYHLNQLLNQMIDLKAGNVVIDVEMKNIRDDEADQGYYEDGSPTPEEFAQLRVNLQQKAQNARESRGRAAVDLISGADLD